MTARNKLKAFTDKLKTVKHIELILLLAAICIGVLVFLAVGEREEKSQKSDARLFRNAGRERRRAA